MTDETIECGNCAFYRLRIKELEDEILVLRGERMVRQCGKCRSGFDDSHPCMCVINVGGDEDEDE